MIVYEINIQVAAIVADAYRLWLRAHVAEILRLPGFIDAQVYAAEDLPGPGPDADQQLCVHYHLHDREALQNYLIEHAPRLRQDGIDRFAAQVCIRRRILQTLD